MLRSEMINNTVNRLKQVQNEYAEACREAYDEGFAPHYCIHGTDLWTDYDNICGGCEDGSFTEHTTDEELIQYATDRVDWYIDRVRATAQSRELVIQEWLNLGLPVEKAEKVARKMYPAPCIPW